MFCNITTTTNKKQIVDKLSEELLKNNYSPCIQVINPVESQYFWNGKVTSTREYKIDIKTLDALVDKVVLVIKSIHNYKVPEIIKTPITIKNKDYEEWMLENTKK